MIVGNTYPVYLILNQPNHTIIMKSILMALTLLTVVMACQPSKKESGEATAPKLTQKWETDTLLTTCESVLYDKQNNILYVANINGTPEGKDGNGFISKVTLDGKIENLKWATDMDAPKGLGIFKNILYVADINRIHEVDITTGKIIKSHTVDSAKFLNDVTVSETGKVYISDTGNDNILLLENGKVSVWLEGMVGINGLLAEGNNIQAISFSSGVFSTVDENKKITILSDSLDNGDGINAVGDGGYLVSSWNGMVHYVSADGKNTRLLDTRKDSVSAADIEYIAEKKLLLVPTFFKNKVVAYELSR